MPAAAGKSRKDTSKLPLPNMAPVLLINRSAHLSKVDVKSEEKEVISQVVSDLSDREIGNITIQFNQGGSQ